MMVDTENSFVTVLVILATFLMASMLNVYPLSAELAVYRPMFLVTMLIFWSMYQPRYVGLVVAFLVGITADLLFDTILGQQAFCTLVATFVMRVATQYISRLTFLTSWAIAGLCLAVFQACLWVLQYITQSIFLIQSVWSLVISLLFWPVISIVLQKFR